MSYLNKFLDEQATELQRLQEVITEPGLEQDSDKVICICQKIIEVQANIIAILVERLQKK